MSAPLTRAARQRQRERTARSQQHGGNAPTRPTWTLRKLTPFEVPAALHARARAARGC